MELTQKQAMDAYRVVRKLEKQDMNGVCAKILFDARKALEPQFQFQDEQECKQIDALGCDVSETGAIGFPDDEARNKYIEKMEEISQLEVDVALEKKRFDIRDIKICPEDIEALESIVEIVC